MLKKTDFDLLNILKRVKTKIFINKLVYLVFVWVIRFKEILNIICTYAVKLYCIG